MSFDTIIAEFTAPGKAAVSGIRISGPYSRQKTEELFDFKFVKPRKAYYLNTEFDNIVLIYYKAPNSYTGEDLIEIFCHGNEEIVRAITDSYLKLGVKLAKAGEYTKRAFLNDKLSLSEAESVQNLINSSSIEEVKASKSVLDGAVSTLLKNIENTLLGFQSHFEYDIDFNEDKESFNPKTVLSEIDIMYKSIKEIEPKLKTHTSFEKINKIIFFGKSNVGKSSIFNKLLGFNRSIVSDIHGTTRDYVSEHSFIENYKVILTDTAGIRDTTEQIEQEGITNTIELAKTKSIKVLVVDDNNFKDRDNYDIIVRNKSDLLKTKQINSDDAIIYLSAKTGDGINILLSKIKALIKMNTEAVSESFLISQRLLEKIHEISHGIAQLLALIKDGQELDILASINMLIINKIKLAQGKSLNDDSIINDIFDTFCVGK